MTQIRAYFINLDRSPERLNLASRTLDKAGVDWVRVPAVDGRDFADLPWPDFDHRAYDRNWGKIPNASELGCYLSHLKALKLARSDNTEFALILEDDADIAPNLNVVLDELVARRQMWDMVKLNGYHRALPVTVDTLTGGHRLVAFTQRNTGAAVYLVNRHAIDRLVAGLLPMNVPYDHAFDQVWRLGFKMRGLLPYPITIAPNLESQISNIAAGPNKKPWYRCATVALYRGKTEGRRILHYLLTEPVFFWYLVRMMNFRNKRSGDIRSDTGKFNR